MEALVKEFPWCVITIDPTKRLVFFQQRWKYRWVTQAGRKPWTTKEKQGFHNRADRAIWTTWSNQAKLYVTGTSALATQLKSSGITINFDIRWVLKEGHWNVTASKIAPGSFKVSRVFWNSRTIELDSEDFRSIERCNNIIPRQCYKQVPVAHEFGHAAGNTVILGRGDEYKSTSVHRNDHGSLINIGGQLRTRHFRTIIEALNKMVPNTSFSIKSLY